ncbi:uncharacterized protein LOC144111274 isoform X3 [Amblyomma americanum]
MENLTTSTVHSQDRLRHPRPMRRRRRESTHCSSDNTCYCRTCEADAAETDRHFNWVTWCPMYLLLAAPHFLGCLPINDDGRVKESLEHGDDPSETHRRLRTSSNCWHHWSRGSIHCSLYCKRIFQAFKKEPLNRRADKATSCQ